ncbi:MAG: hypothetical protein JOZ08_10625 [Verrucomicrobia bacterium]|nr:hypothetical protein [Verrucomicrobiota bacterium]MBV8279665.1 hypothetical protein [Verrucomicrobiota bacterium]
MTQLVPGELLTANGQTANGKPPTPWLTLGAIAISHPCILLHMKKLCLVLLVSGIGLAACERHPAGQLQEASEQGQTKTEASPSTQPASSATPKTFFPQNS